MLAPADVVSCQGWKPANLTALFTRFTTAQLRLRYEFQASVRSTHLPGGRNSGKTHPSTASTCAQRGSLSLYAKGSTNFLPAPLPLFLTATAPAPAAAAAVVLGIATPLTACGACWKRNHNLQTLKHTHHTNHNPHTTHTTSNTPNTYTYTYTYTYSYTTHATYTVHTYIHSHTPEQTPVHDTFRSLPKPG